MDVFERPEQLARSLQKRDRLRVLALEVVQSPERRQSCGQLLGLGRRVKLVERGGQKCERLRITGRDIRAADLHLQHGAFCRAGYKIMGALVVIDGQLQGSAHSVDITYKLRDSGELLRLVQRLGALLSDLIVVQRFIIGENAPGVLRRAQRIDQPALSVVAGNRVKSQHMRVVSVTRCVQLLQCRADALVQPAAADRIQPLVQGFANLVVREGKAIGLVGADELGGAGFVERVEQRIFICWHNRGQFGECKRLP